MALLGSLFWHCFSNGPDALPVSRATLGEDSTMTTALLLICLLVIAHYASIAAIERDKARREANELLTLVCGYQEADDERKVGW